MVSPTPVRAGAQTTLEFHGEVGDLVLLAVAQYPGWTDKIAIHSGPLLLGGPAFVGPMGTVPAGGVLMKTLDVPELLGGAESEVLYLQSIFVGGGASWLASPSSAVVLDPVF